MGVGLGGFRIHCLLIEIDDSSQPFFVVERALKKTIRKWNGGNSLGNQLP